MRLALTVQVAKQHQQQLLSGQAPAWQPDRSWHGVLTDSAESSAVDVSASQQQQQQQGVPRAPPEPKHAAGAAGANSSVAAATAASSTPNHHHPHEQQPRASTGHHVSPYLQQPQHRGAQQPEQPPGVLQELVETEGERQQRRQRQQQALQRIQQQKRQQQQQLQQTYASKGASPGKPVGTGTVAALREDAAARSRAMVEAHISQAEEALRVSESGTARLSGEAAAAVPVHGWIADIVQETQGFGGIIPKQHMRGSAKTKCMWMQCHRKVVCAARLAAPACHAPRPGCHRTGP